MNKIGIDVDNKLEAEGEKEAHKARAEALEKGAEQYDQSGGEGFQPGEGDAYKKEAAEERFAAGTSTRDNLSKAHKEGQSSGTSEPSSDPTEAKDAKEFDKDKSASPSNDGPSID